MKTALRFGLLASVLLSATSARAEDRAACLAAASSGQTMRDAHNLIEARDQFRICAQQQCPAVVRNDCTGWLDAVEKSIATVVITAKDASGADLFDVEVSVDGKPLLARLTGQAIPVNPGLRTFHFDFADDTSLDQPMLVKEGEKNQTIFALRKRRNTATPAAPKSEEPAMHAPTQPAKNEESMASSPPGLSSDVSTPSGSGGSAPWKTMGWVVGGAGVVGLAVGTVFGVMAMGDKNSANCDSSNFCDSGPLSNARHASGVANAGFIAGGVLLAGGIALVLFGPADQHEGAGAVRVTPMLGKNVGAISVGGSWQ